MNFCVGTLPHLRPLDIRWTNNTQEFPLNIVGDMRWYLIQPKLKQGDITKQTKKKQQEG